MCPIPAIDAKYWRNGSEFLYLQNIHLHCMACDRAIPTNYWRHFLNSRKPIPRVKKIAQILRVITHRVIGLEKIHRLSSRLFSHSIMGVQLSSPLAPLDTTECCDGRGVSFGGLNWAPMCWGPPMWRQSLGVVFQVRCNANRRLLWRAIAIIVTMFYHCIYSRPLVTIFRPLVTVFHHYFYHHILSLFIPRHYI